MWEWLWNIVGWLGLWKREATLLFVGLDNAGKTTLLHMLRDDRLVQHTPTMHPTMEELTLGNLRFRTFDMGGHQAARKLWLDYYAAADAIVFIVDSSDRERMAEARNELAEVLSTDDLLHVPVLVLGNKIDKPGAAGEEELRDLLHLHHTSGKDGPCPDTMRPLELFMCSIRERQGFGPGFVWLSKVV